MIETEVKKENFQLKMAAFVVALVFLLSFIYIEKIPYDWVLYAYEVFTAPWHKMAMIAASVIFLYATWKEKHFGYAFLLIAYLAGQFLFVNVFGDNYTLGSEPGIEFEGRKMYFPNQNLG